MPLQLAELYVDILTRGDTDVMRKLASVKSATEGVGSAVAIAATGKSPVDTEAIGAATKGMEGLKTIVEGTESKLLSMSNIDFGLLLKLGTLAGVAALIGAGVKKFAGTSDDLAMMGERFRMTGANAEESISKVKAFTNEMLGLGVAESESRAAITSGLARGFPLEQAMATQRAAHGLASALNVSTEHAGSLLRRYQEMGSLALRREDVFRAMIRRGASEVEVQARLNKLIAEGTKLAEFKKENTFAGAMTQLWVAFDKVLSIIGKVFGPAIIADITRVASAIGAVVNVVRAWADANPAVIEFLGKIVEVGLIMVGVFAGLKVVSLILGGVHLALGLVSVSLGTATAGWAAFWAAAAGPAALVIGIIAGVAAALAGLWKLLDPIGFGKFFDWLAAKFTSIKESLLGKAKDITVKPGGGEGINLEPGMTKKSSFEALDKLWKDVQLAGVEGGGRNTAEMQLHATEKTNQILTEWSATGLPVQERDPRPVQPRG